MSVTFQRSQNKIMNKQDAKKPPLFLLVMLFILVCTGFFLVWKETNITVVIGIYLIFWGNNIQQSILRKRGK